MHSNPARLLLLAIVCVTGCTGVRLLPGSDPRIADGMTEYQESLENFVGQALLHYEQCAASPDDAAACRAASYASGAESFYIPEAARLRVLRTFAAVLDSAGACETNCTEGLVQTVIENHEALAEGHRRIDEGLAAEQAAPFFLVQRDTLVQNVRIVLLLEEAKIRGRPSR